MKDRQTRLQVVASTGLMQRQINKFVEPLLFHSPWLGGWPVWQRGARQHSRFAQASTLQGG
jgi:hypothetical protein